MDNIRKQAEARGFSASTPARSEILAVVESAGIELTRDDLQQVIFHVRKYMGTHRSQLRNTRKNLRPDNYLAHLGLDIAIISRSLVEFNELSPWMAEFAKSLPTPSEDHVA